MTQMIKCYNGSDFGGYKNKSFSEIFPDFETFLNEYKSNGFGVSIKDETVRVIYYAIYATHGEDRPASLNTNMFKYKLWYIIYNYAPTFEKKTELQLKLRSLTDEEILDGTTAIYNHANNSGAPPSSSTKNIFNYVDDQNVTRYTKDKKTGYVELYDLLRDNLIQTMMSKIDKLFNVVVSPDRPLLYEEMDIL